MRFTSFPPNQPPMRNGSHPHIALPIDVRRWLCVFVFLTHIRRIQKLTMRTHIGADFKTSKIDEEVQLNESVERQGTRSRPVCGEVDLLAIEMCVEFTSKKSWKNIKECKHFKHPIEILNEIMILSVLSITSHPWQYVYKGMDYSSRPAFRWLRHLWTETESTKCNTPIWRNLV